MSDFRQDTPSDPWLWEQMRQGDEKAFAALFARYHGTLYNYGCKLSTDTALVEDAVQEVFVDVWRLRATLAPELLSVKFYLYRALRRRIHRARDRFREENIADISETWEDLNLFFGSYEEELIGAEEENLLSGRIQELIAALPQRQVEALTLRYFDDFSVEEIASIMEVTGKSVRNFLYKALSALREHREWLVISFLLFCRNSFF